MSALTFIEVLKVVIVPIIIGFGANFFSKFIDRRYLEKDKKQEYQKYLQEINAYANELTAYVQQLKILTRDDSSDFGAEQHFIAGHLLEEISRVLKSIPLNKLPECLHGDLVESRSGSQFHVYQISRIKSRSSYNIEVIEATNKFAQRIEEVLIEKIIKYLENEKI